MTKLIEMLKRHEGVRNHIYTDSLGYQTIGVGRNIQNGISDKEIDFLLLNDMERVISELENNFNWFSDMEWARRDAIINIAFNLGITRLLLFKKALNAMSQKDYSRYIFYNISFSVRDIVRHDILNGLYIHFFVMIAANLNAFAIHF